MAVNLKSAVAVTFMMIAASSFPASAGPKSDCDSGVKHAEDALKNGALNREQVNRVRKVVANLRKLQSDGKYKKCVEIAANLKKQLGTN